MRTPPLIPRRRFLRGLGTAIALPVFESLLPTNLRAAAADPASAVAGVLYPKRLVFTHVPNGMADMSLWTPKTTGSDYEIPRILEPLKDFKKQLLIVTGLAQSNGEAVDPVTGQNDGGGIFARANAVYLTGARPLKSQAPRLGISADQIAASKIGAQTDLPSLQLSCDAHGPTGMCDDVYACSYQYCLSWKDQTTAIDPDVSPHLVFEQLFVTGAFPNETPDVRFRRIQSNQSVLDLVIDEARLLKASLGLADRAKFDQYLTAVRDVEKRIANYDKAANDHHANPDFEEWAKLLFDLQVLALQGNRTRVITFSYGHEGSNRPYPQIGVTDGHEALVGRGVHGPSISGVPISPSQDRAAPVPSLQVRAAFVEKIAKINVYHTTLFAGFLQKLQATPEGSGTLLDNCLVSYGSGLSDDFNKSNSNLPILVAGSGGGALKTGQHLDLGANRKTPLNNLWLTLLDIVGAPIDKFGDSTGKLTAVLA